MVIRDYPSFGHVTFMAVGETELCPAFENAITHMLQECGMNDAVAIMYLDYFLHAVT